MTVSTLAVEKYVQAAPAGARKKINELRRAVKDAVPGADESFSYGMIYYSYRGRLAWIGVFRDHIGFFVRPPVLQEHKEVLKGYTMTKSSLHLPLSRKMPTGLVKKLARAAARKNDASWRSG